MEFYTKYIQLLIELLPDDLQNNFSLYKVEGRQDNTVNGY